MDNNNDIKTVNVGGKPPVKQLFFGFGENDDQALYDMEEFHQTFLEEEDFTEYRPAVKLTGSWAEWNRIKSSWPTFRYNITAWKEELEIKLRSRAMAKLTSLVDSSSEQTAANVCKFLVTCGYDERKGAGRPSKSERTKAAAEIAKTAADTVEEEGRVLELLAGGRK